MNQRWAANKLTAGNMQRGVSSLRLRVYLSSILQELGSHLHSVFLRTQMEWGQAILRLCIDLNRNAMVLLLSTPRLTYS
jgi:hypothetical protein